MELDRIEILLEKYFEGATSIAEEKELQDYFSGDVAQHLEQYKPIFGYFAIAREQQFEQNIPLQSKKRRVVAWLSVAASVVVLVGVGTFAYFNQTQSQDLGTYDSPEEAFRETQKALALLSDHVNTGVESVQYIQTYETTKDRVFVDHHN
jgi:predicted ribosomally synthesized peptide with SipW-like signal peptide